MRNIIRHKLQKILLKRVNLFFTYKNQVQYYNDCLRMVPIFKTETMRLLSVQHKISPHQIVSWLCLPWSRIGTAFIGRSSNWLGEWSDTPSIQVQILVFQQIKRSDPYFKVLRTITYSFTIKSINTKSLSEGNVIAIVHFQKVRKQPVLSFQWITQGQKLHTNCKLS